jgi:hypothetical protein
MHAWVRDIKGALTVQVLIQFLELRQQLQNFVLDTSIGMVPILQAVGMGTPLSNDR